MNEVIPKHLINSDGKYELFHSDGIELKELEDKSEYLDAVLTDPTYCLKNERYSKSVGGEGKRDLNNMNYKEYMNSIERYFKELYRLIKISSYADKKFYPVIWKTGTGRSSDKGINDMDFNFRR
jgi:hypothetical protein